jgi:hypothetical protein
VVVSVGSQISRHDFEQVGLRKTNKRELFEDAPLGCFNVTKTESGTISQDTSVGSLMTGRTVAGVVGA